MKEIEPALTLSFTGDQVPEEIYCDAVIIWQVAACIYGEELIDLSLALKLGSKLGGSDIVAVIGLDLINIFHCGLLCFSNF